jgi:hypothetical protein
MPSFTAMDEDAKVHWAETVDKARYRQFTISGDERQKVFCELALCSTRCYLRTRKFGLLGKSWEIWARNSL